MDRTEKEEYVVIGKSAHDSYFKASIFIGSDFTILIVIIPLAVIAFIKMRINPVAELYIQNLAIFSVLLYYSASIAFGVTYNRLLCICCNF